MKYAIIIPDGAADRPVDELDGKTIFEAANIPHMDKLAKSGELGMVKTVPENYPPGSDVAIMSLLGYDPAKYYTGRAPIEAAAQDIPLTQEKIVFRCNLVTLEDGVMADFTAGHISTQEASELITSLNEKLAESGVKFHLGVSYRHLMIAEPASHFTKLETTPPHDITDQSYVKHLPIGDGEVFVRELMIKSQEILPDLPVNKARVARGEKPANSIWLWGQGQKPTLDTFEKLYEKTGAAVTAVDLVRGLAKLINWDVLEIENATGWIDTNYEGKAKAACDALDEVDVVVVHMEGPDESGHQGDFKSKIYALEQIDKIVVPAVLRKLQSFEEWRVLIMPDHPTPICLKTHTSDPVPYLIAGSDIKSCGAESLSEVQAQATGIKVDVGHTLMSRFLTTED